MFNHIICRAKRSKVSLIFFDNLQMIQPLKVEILFHWPGIANLRTVKIIYDIYTVKAHNIAHLSLLTSVGYNREETNLKYFAQSNKVIIILYLHRV